MHNREKYDNNGRNMAFGLIILFLGVILLADNLNFLPYGAKSIILSWQMLLIAIGILNLSGRRSYYTGVILILVGVFFLLPKIFMFSFEFTRLFWPVILIAAGIVIVFRRGFSHRHDFHYMNKNQAFNDSSDNYINEANIFGGSKIRIVSKNFKGGKITSVFGGSEIDLTNAQLAEGINVLDIACIFGGTILIVPSDWHIRTEVVSILGGFADKRQGALSSSTEHELVIKGLAIFGGGEIKTI